MNKKILSVRLRALGGAAVMAATFLLTPAVPALAQASVSVNTSSTQTSDATGSTQSSSSTVTINGTTTTSSSTQTSTDPSASQSVSISAVASSASTANLVPNPTLATTGADGLPVSWLQGGWGTNTPVFTYPVAGYGDNFAAKVQIASYTDGDAKWYFAPVAVTAGTYQFSDYYQSDTASILTAQYIDGSGNTTYADLASLASSTAWKNATVNFTVPAGTARITIMHLIKSVGWLTVDNYSLTTYTAPVIPQPPAPTAANLILNPSLEYLDAANLPIGWLTGGWGNNTAGYTVYSPGMAGKYAAQAQITSYTDGDAKWYFAPVAVKPNYKYTFKDYFQSNTASYVTVEIQLADGTNKYVDLGSRAAAANWTQFGATFSTPPTAKTATVYHLIKGVGWLRTDNFGLAENGPSQLSAGVVSLDFDDGWLSAYQKAYPILKTAGLKASYYIFTDAFKDPYDYMTLAQAKILYAAGNEIGSHSTTHSDLTTLTSAQLTSEISGSKLWFLRNGINAATFAYPYGAYNQTVETAIKNSGYVGARTSDGGYNDKASNKYETKIYSVENTTTIEQIKTWIDYAKANKVWLTLLFHEVLDNTSADQYSTTPAIIQQTADYLKSQQVSVKTNAQALTLLGL